MESKRTSSVLHALLLLMLENKSKLGNFPLNVDIYHSKCLKDNYRRGKLKGFGVILIRILDSRIRLENFIRNPLLLFCQVK